MLTNSSVRRSLQWTCLSAVLAVLFFNSVQPASAQYQPRFTQEHQSDTGYKAPQLQGATMGTIGPQGEEPTYIEGVNTSSAQVIMTEFPRMEQVTITGATLSMSALLALFLLRKKKAAMWSLGATSAAVLLVSGFAWGILAV